MGKPLVSVLIPTYNQAGYVGDAIRSALEQDLGDLEVIVSDDCSSDGTADVVRGFSDLRLRYEPSARNLGRVANYRRGLYELARGTWVLNLDGDDFLTDSTFLRAAVAAAGDGEPASIVFADRYEREGAIDPRSFPSGGAASGAPERMDGTSYVLSLPRKDARMHHLCALYRRDAARAIGFYRADIVSSDYESLYRLALSHPIVHIPAKVGVWRRHGANASGGMDARASIENYRLFQGVHDFAVESAGLDPRAFGDWLLRNVSRRYYVSLMGYLRGGALGEFRTIDRYVRAQYPAARRRALLSPKTWVKASICAVSSFKSRVSRRA
jgi:glycosyltransferase involved in cell wall biosynthesis